MARLPLCLSTWVLSLHSPEPSGPIEGQRAQKRMGLILISAYDNGLAIDEVCPALVSPSPLAAAAAAAAADPQARCIDACRGGRWADAPRRCYTLLCRLGCTLNGCERCGRAVNLFVSVFVVVVVVIIVIIGVVFVTATDLVEI